MGSSLESSRPMLNEKRASTRLSTYSATPTLTPSIAPSRLSDASGCCPPDPKTQDLTTWNAGFARLEDKRLQQQRYALAPEQSDQMGKIALGAKVEKALGRRMTGQDAVFTSGGPGAAAAAAAAAGGSGHRRGQSEKQG